MSGEERSRVADADEASTKLNEGLKTCRAMVANYRAMLTDEPGNQPANDVSEYLHGESERSGRSQEG